MEPLQRIASLPVQRRSPVAMIVVIVFALATLAVLISFVVGLGWDGY